MNIFFKPSSELVKWLIDYAKDRVIIEIGCGEDFTLIKQLHRQGYKRLVGIDYNMSPVQVELFKIQNDYQNMPHLLPWDIKEHPTLLKHPEGLYIFARPCHSDFVEWSIDNMNEGNEALYITLPENLDKYDDLGKYKEGAVLLEHKGKSVDNEVIYSITK